MKYIIDVEKLKDEIERRIKSVESCPFIEAEFGAEMRREGKIQTYNEILSLIDSLQQEQEQYVIGGQVFGATDIEQLYKGKVYIVSKSLQDKEFGIYPGKRIKMLLIKD